MIDFVFGLAAFSLAELLFRPFELNTKLLALLRREETETEDGERDLLQTDSGQEQREPIQGTEQTPLLVPQMFRVSSRDGPDRKRLLKPLSILTFLLFLQLVSPLYSRSLLLSSSNIERQHPSPQDPDYTYPPVPVGCVASPRGEGNKLDLLLKETKIVASKGAKVISWEETGVKIEESERSQRGREREMGWEGMGAEEKELLKRVAEVADVHKVSQPLGVTLIDTDDT